MGAAGTSKPELTEAGEVRRPPAPAEGLRDQYASYKRLVDRAVEVFGSDLTASRWLSMPSVDLGGKVPLQIAQAAKYDSAEMDAIFEPIFIRIEHGIYW